MACDAATSGMGDALAVDHQQIRLVPDPTKGLQESRSFAKRQQTGDVGKIQFRNHAAFLYDLQVGEAQYNDTGKSPRRVFG